MLSNIKPDQQAQASQWERERKLLQHHKTKVKTKDVQYYNVISWDLVLQEALEMEWEIMILIKE